MLSAEENIRLRDSFNQLLIEGDKNGCIEIVKILNANNIPILDLYEKLFRTSLYKVGRLWEQNKISVATEHLATAITENILNWLYLNKSPHPQNYKTALLTCIENEYHRVGITMVSDIFERNEWRTLTLGADTPSKSILTLAETVKPDVLGISVSLYQNIPGALQLVKQYRAVLPGKKIILGGQAFNHYNQNFDFSSNDVIILKDLYQLDLLLQNKEV